MRLRIHHPLFAGFLGVIGLLVALIMLLVGTGLRRELRATFEDELRRHLDLGAAVIASARGHEADSLARVITDRIGHRVTIIDTLGVVLGDSFVERGRLASVENHLGRPEVAAVLLDGEPIAFAERTSATVAESLLYAARMTRLGDEPVLLRIAAAQTDIAAAVGRVQRAVAAAGLVAMLVALLVAYAVSFAFARPLVTLADRARRLAEGDFASTVRSSRVTELNDVAVAFNRLGEQLRARLSELGHERDEMQALIDCMAEGVIALDEDGRLLRMNRTALALLRLREAPVGGVIGTLVRHPELRRALAESVKRPFQSTEIVMGGRHLLLASRALDLGGSVTTLLDISELRRLEQVRTDFVANASHELKTPLTSIRGFAETLVADDPPEELRRQFLTSIRNNTLRLQRLVDDLLDLSRLESGGWSAEVAPVDLRDVVEEAWDLVAPRAKEGLEFSIDGDCTAMGDRQAIVQIVRNLLDNATRHTDEGGSVLVRLGEGEREGTVELVVSDDGEGIPARALARIFERFYRADSSRARDFGGTGLGLAIVKHLAGAMGGDVVAESELGRGATFTVTLPAPEQRWA